MRRASCCRSPRCPSAPSLKQGDPVLTMMPVASAIEAEVHVATRDIGFLRVGDRTRLKIDAFNSARTWLCRGQGHLDQCRRLHDRRQQPTGRGLLQGARLRRHSAFHRCSRQFPPHPGHDADAPDVNVGTRLARPLHRRRRASRRRRTDARRVTPRAVAPPSPGRSSAGSHPAPSRTEDRDALSALAESDLIDVSPRPAGHAPCLGVADRRRASPRAEPEARGPRLRSGSGGRLRLEWRDRRAGPPLWPRLPSGPTELGAAGRAPQPGPDHRPPDGRLQHGASAYRRDEGLAVRHPRGPHREPRRPADPRSATVPRRLERRRHHGGAADPRRRRDGARSAIR